MGKLREKQEALEADLVQQTALQLIKAGKVHRLRDCYVRPNVGGKKSSGTLELHANGLRFTTSRGEKLDLIFKNIKLALFQAAEKEIIVDVPLALTIMFSNFLWPVEYWNQFINGDLVADADEITVSPR